MRTLIRHLLIPRWWWRRRFPPAALEAIRQAISEAERRHGGEICFAIETCLGLRRLREPAAGRRRAGELFGQLDVWDTSLNNGVLIYVVLASHEIHIVADRGLAKVVVAAEWRRVCELMETHFRKHAFEAGALAGIAAVSALIEGHFPTRPGAVNELADEPFMLG